MHSILRKVVFAAVITTCAATNQAADFNGDELYNCEDIDPLVAAIASGSGGLPEYDLDGNGVLDRNDVTAWLIAAGNATIGRPFPYGDIFTGLPGLFGNGIVDANDTDIIQANKYAFGSFCDGDVNADGFVDALDNAIVHANVFVQHHDVGSDGTPVQRFSDFYYDPLSGNLWSDTGGEPTLGWHIPGPDVVAFNELSETFQFGALIPRGIHFNNAMQSVGRTFDVTGVFQNYVYPTGLTEADFGDVIVTRMDHSLTSGLGLEMLVVPPVQTEVTVATVRSWTAVDGNWLGADWSGGAPPNANEVAVLDFGAGNVGIDAGTVAESIETFVRSGNLRIDGEHVGDVTVFDSSHAPYEEDSPIYGAAVSGGGQIDGNLVLMGRLSLAAADALHVTGSVILSERYWAIGSTGPAGAAMLDVDGRGFPTAGTTTEEFLILAADGGVEGLFTSRLGGPLDVDSPIGDGRVRVESIRYTETEVFVSLQAALPGDANWDGLVDVSDFNIWNANKFTSDANWQQGDFNGDGSVDTSDFNIWNANKFQSLDAIPEPHGIWILVASISGIVLAVRRN